MPALSELEGQISLGKLTDFSCASLKLGLQSGEPVTGARTYTGDKVTAHSFNLRNDSVDI